MLRKPKVDVAAVQAENAALLEQLATTKLQLSAAHLQLQFFRENARQMENQMRVWQGMYLEAMKTVSKLGVETPDFTHHAGLVRDALEAPQNGVEALIKAVSIAATQDRSTLARLLPDMAPLLKRLKKVPRLPATQGVSGVSAERTAISSRGSRRE